MLTKGAHNMKNFINTSYIIKIKRETMTIGKGQTNIKTQDLSKIELFFV